LRANQSELFPFEIRNIFESLKEFTPASLDRNSKIVFNGSGTNTCRVFINRQV
jgi:hypothetical protein